MYDPDADVLDRPAEAPLIDGLRHRRIQMLLAFRRWDKAWGMYPAQWEVDAVSADCKSHAERPASDWQGYRE